MEDRFNMTLEENIFLAKKELEKNIYSNARVEGINVDLLEIHKILEGTNVSRLSIDEIQCILNLRDAWKYVIENVSSPINLEYICKINEFVSRNESLKWGVLREGKIGISGVDYIPPIPNKEKVEKEINDILSIENITLRAIKYMLYGMRTQLFWDGNKRTSTICANKILIENGKGIIRIPDNCIEEFNTLLSNYYNTNIESPILEFIYNHCIYGIEYEK